MIPFADFDVMTFDCYGTLIDWETGILEAMQPILRAHDVELNDEQVLQAFAAFETEAERTYTNYRATLATVCQAFGNQYHFTPSAMELQRFQSSVGAWPPFPDSPSALTQLKERYRVGVITNCDDDLFELSSQRLGISFEWVITAQQVRSYKPSEQNFLVAFERIGVARSRIIHVAQSLFHDHVPAKQLGLTTIWINRRQSKEGHGATLPAVARPDLEVPDLRTLAALVSQNRHA